VEKKPGNNTQDDETSFSRQTKCGRSLGATKSTIHQKVTPSNMTGSRGQQERTAQCDWYRPSSSKGRVPKDCFLCVSTPKKKREEEVKGEKGRQKKARKSSGGGRESMNVQKR